MHLYYELNHIFRRPVHATQEMAQVQGLRPVLVQRGPDDYVLRVHVGHKPLTLARQLQRQDINNRMRWTLIGLDDEGRTISLTDHSEGDARAEAQPAADFDPEPPVRKKRARS